MSELDVIGALTGTDKSSSVSWAWDYLRHYEELFAPFRQFPINLIEIGVAGGASLAAWERYFERATLVGIDINPDATRYAQGRVFIRIGSQEDSGFLHGVAAAFPPSIVIDDGSHLAHHMIASFETLFPALAPGGVYIFEDLAFHFDESARRFQDAAAHQGLSEHHIYDYLNKFMRARAAAVEIPEKTWGFARYAFANIDSITVAGGFIAVRKTAARDTARDIAQFEDELARTHDRAAVGQRYVEYLLRHNTSLDRAASLLSEILGYLPADEANWMALVNVLSGLGRLDDAADAASRLIALSPTNAAYWDQLAALQRRRGRPDLELPAIQRLAALQPNAAGFQLRLSELLHDAGDRPAALDAARRAAALEPANADFRNRVAALE